MARIRTLKPEILEDEMTAGLSDGAFRLFVAMIVLADDHGNVRAEERWLEGQVWWSRRFAEVRGEIPRVAEILRELSEALLIELYEVRSQFYAHIRSWEKHQRIDNAGKPRVPGPSESSRNFAEFRGEIPRFAAGPRPPTSDHDPEKKEASDLAVGPLGLLSDAPEVGPESEVGPEPPKGKGKVRPPRRVRELPQEALDAADHLLRRIVENNAAHKLSGASESKRSPTIQAWADHLRKLHEIDGRSWGEIRSVIDWCQDDAFWGGKGNIASGEKLREKWNTLTAQRGHAMRAPPAPAKPKPMFIGSRLYPMPNVDEGSS